MEGLFTVELVVDGDFEKIAVTDEVHKAVVVANSVEYAKIQQCSGSSKVEVYVTWEGFTIWTSPGKLLTSVDLLENVKRCKHKMDLLFGEELMNLPVDTKETDS